MLLFIALLQGSQRVHFSSHAFCSAHQIVKPTRCTTTVHLRDHGHSVTWSLSQRLAFPISSDKKWSPEPLSSLSRSSHCCWQPAFSLGQSLVAMAQPKIIKEATSPSFPWLMQHHCWPLFWFQCIYSFTHSFSIYWVLNKPQRSNLNKISSKTHKDKVVECVLMVSPNLPWPRPHSW